MRVTTTRRDLLELLGKLESVGKSKTTLTVLNHFLVKAGKSEIEATACNLEVYLSGKCKAKVEEVGAILLPISVMSFLRASKAEKVTLIGTRTGKRVRKSEPRHAPPVEGEPESKPQYQIVYSYQVAVEANGSKTTLPSHGTDEYPPIHVAEGKKVEISDLDKALKEVSYAVARSDTRPVLECVNFASKRGVVELAAADGFRLAVTNAKAKGNLAESALIPLHAVALLEKLCHGKATIQVSPKTETSSQWATFRYNGLVLTTLVMQGTYPNYAQLIPKKGGYLTVDTKCLQEAVRMAGVTANQGSGIIRLKTTSKGLVVSASCEDQVTETVIAAKGNIKIAFEHKYMAELLNRISEQVTFRTTTPSAPGVVNNNGTTHVLMPRFVQW